MRRNRRHRLVFLAAAAVAAALVTFDVRWDAAALRGVGRLRRRAGAAPRRPATTPPGGATLRLAAAGGPTQAAAERDRQAGRVAEAAPRRGSPW